MNFDVELNSIVNDEIHFDNNIRYREEIIEGVYLDAFVRIPEKFKKIIVFMPSAQNSKSEVLNPIFHRWSWASSFPDAGIVSISDPGLYEAELSACWFLSTNRDVDYISRIGDFVRSLCGKLSISESDVLIYGSSMGGYGSLMLASELNGSLAIAEVPQLNLVEYPVQAAIRNIEKSLTSSINILDYYSENPFLINVLKRFLHNSYVPPFKIITNKADTEFKNHLNFISEISSLGDEVERVGDYELKIISDEIGHKPLGSQISLAEIKASMSLSWSVSENNLTSEVAIKKAVDLISKLKFIRDDKEKSIYQEAKDLLYFACEDDVNADWPYLRLCSLVKLWTNSFNSEILECAEKAFQRKAGLESFIYCCRGYLYNYDLGVAELKVNLLMSQVEDYNVKNIGNVFLSIIAYEKNDYLGYQKYVTTFNSTKETGFEPYITIPVSTVYTGLNYADSLSNDSELLGKSLSIVEKPGEYSYVISISCDKKYFEKYAEYLVKSFSHHCSEEALLHISLVDGDLEYVTSKINEWGANNVVVAVQGLDAGENVGPLASLLRFSHLSSLLEYYNVPVFILDLDAVIKQSFQPIVENYKDVDVCSRILGGGVAPWEKFTGGFSMFNTSPLSLKVACNIAYVANKMAKSGKPQWWIDQNCFEAGLRSVFDSKDELSIENVMSIRDKYCVMPVGSGESKEHNLKLALKASLD